MSGIEGQERRALRQRAQGAGRVVTGVYQRIVAGELAIRASVFLQQDEQGRHNWWCYRCARGGAWWRDLDTAWRSAVSHADIAHEGGPAR